SVAAVSLALAIVLVPWAVIAFHGIGGYPGLLHHLAADEASSSYSVTALAVRAHLPEAVGVALSLLAAAALLVAAAVVARDRRRSPSFVSEACARGRRRAVDCAAAPRAAVAITLTTSTRRVYLVWARSLLSPSERLLPGLGARLDRHPRFVAACLAALRRAPR